MKKAYAHISYQLLERLIGLPSSIHIETVMPDNDYVFKIVLVDEGAHIPKDAEQVNILVTEKQKETTFEKVG